MTDLRELDLLIGRKVMGFREIVRGSVDYYVDGFGPLPHYSTDPVASDALDEKVLLDGWSTLCVRVNGLYYYLMDHMCCGGVQECATTKYLARAKAAVKAYGLEVPEE